MKVTKLIAVLVFVFFCVSAVVGPAYGWKGENNGVSYEIYISREYDNTISKNMRKDWTHDFKIIAKNGTLEVSTLNIILPTQFVLRSSKSGQGFWPALGWAHIFEIKAPNETGQYSFGFEGKDSQGNPINFSVPINVVDKDTTDESLGFGEGTGGLVIVGGITVALLLILTLTGVVKF